MVALAKTVLDARVVLNSRLISILVVHLLLLIVSCGVQKVVCFFEILYSLCVVAGFQLGNASSVPSLREVGLELNCLVEVIYCKLVVSHILVD
jgi:hypothetical protein